MAVGRSHGKAPSWLQIRLGTGPVWPPICSGVRLRLPGSRRRREGNGDSTVERVAMHSTTVGGNQIVHTALRRIVSAFAKRPVFGSFSRPRLSCLRRDSRDRPSSGLLEAT
jgi:hypothetical protein